jgi:acyl transferase domain-containing protein/NAD(P)H-dependent flavin oxidoreductase YrpB (nitropropane dioxygenase family)/NAD(P)-dependent dehydrogenase (short-subunit alcohol dehydrogenase family)
LDVWAHSHTFLTMPQSVTDSFEVLALDRLADGMPLLAAAAARAGGTGAIDLEYARGDVERRAVRAVRWLLDHVDDSRSIAVRLTPTQIVTLDAVLDELKDTGATIVLAAATAAADAFERARGASCRLLVEARSLDDCEVARSHGCDGIIATGNETGGRVGSDTTFILVQKLLQHGDVPVFARGGIGIHTAAGCRAVGVRGVVLDDQLLLMAESSLPRAWRANLVGLSGQETVVLGDGLGRQGYRLLDRPTFGGLVRLKNVHRALDSAGDDPRGEWPAAIDEAVGWHEPDAAAWPVGQAIGLATVYQHRYGTTARVVEAFARESRRLVAQARAQNALAAGGPLAKSHGTEFPIVQGPMTRVSDSPAFARAVADAGALPLVALAVMTGAQAAPILEATREELRDKPWGVGILGFVPAELKREQIQELLRVRPSFALIAGGRVDESSALEAHGIPTYLHTPAPSLLRRFLTQGARRFVLEGRECGGHVGPLCSFPLWEAMIEVLLEHPAADAPQVHVLFAGGIHDGRSAAIVAAMAAPLVDRGIRIGVLMGTAYLFTEEAVRAGAILARYQDEAIRCRQTVLLASGVGHANRVADTAFAADYEQRRIALQRAGQPPAEIREELERLTLGRLRLASKGVARQEGQEIAPVSAAEQASGGIYMLGQAATLRSRSCRMIDLHRDVASGMAAVPARTAVARSPGRSAVAIIGMAALVPGARVPEAFWRNILDRVSAIEELPPGHWDMRLLFDANKSTRDKTFAKWGGFVDAIPFDPMTHRIPPAVMRHVCAHQLLALELTRWTLADAGYAERPFDRERTSVVVAAAETGGWQGNKLILRSMLPFFFEDVPERVLQRLPEWTPESFPGMLGNVSAGRVANHFDFGGPNYALDAACASSLLALDQSVRELQSGRSSLVLAAAVDTSQTPFSFLAFSKTQALSPTGEARVFDKTADGIVISEGVAMLALKRLDDAERDGDRVYSVIRGTGASSDGRGHGLTAPRVEGQRLALQRAFLDAGVRSREIALYEAHGTGTPLGDRTEIETLAGMLKEDGAEPKTCAVGSIKSLIGHTKAVAGLIGVAKASLALYHRTLPPHAGATNPLEELRDPGSPLYLLNAPRPWFRDRRTRRLAGVSAFGFGGTNGALVLEEADNGASASLGAPDWPCELFLFAGADRHALADRIAATLGALVAGAEPRLRDLAAALAGEFEQREPRARLAFAASTPTELLTCLREAEAVARGTTAAVAGIAFSDAEPTTGRVAFLFPGQGSQYPGMAAEQTLYLDEMRAAVELADHTLASEDSPPLSSAIFPPGAFSDAEHDAARRALAQTSLAQPAIGAISAGLFDVLIRLGLAPSAVAGHSYGELTALHAAGALSRVALFELSHARGRAMEHCCDAGGMVSAPVERVAVERLVANVSGISIASHNAPAQTVVSGPAGALVEALGVLANAGIRGTRLPVSGAFHSPLMTPATAPWRAALERVDVRMPMSIPVYSTVDAAPYADDPEAVRRGLIEQLVKPVEFVRTIERLYADGVRTFIEVGPGAVLASLTLAILHSRPGLVVATDAQGGKLRGFLNSVGALAVAGVPLCPTRLFDNRDVRVLTLDRLDETRPAPIPKTAWMVDGLTARPVDETGAGGLSAPLVTADTRAAFKEDIRQHLPQPSAVPMFEQSGLPAVGGDERADAVLAAYTAYQHTMERFLEMQERALQTFLGLSGALPALATAVAPTAPSASPTANVEPAPRSAPVVTPAPASPVTAPPQAVSADDIKSLLLKTASAQTGYPPEMLGLELDLASDLGVDSIRHVQILTDVVAALPAEVGARLESEMEALARARTLQDVLDHLVRLAETTRAAAPAIPTSTSPAAAAKRSIGSAPRDAHEVLKALQQITSERTGYPIEMLAPEHDLEADLGVDSIRRAEIVQAMMDRLGTVSVHADGTIEHIMRARSLGDMAQAISRTTADDRDGAADGASPARPAGDGEPPEATCPRFKMVAVECPLNAAAVRGIEHGVVLITEDDIGVTPLVRAALRQRGVAVSVLPRHELSNPQALWARLDEIEQPIRAILHLAPLARRTMPAAFADWKAATACDVKALFVVLQQTGRRSQRPTSVVAASLLGGWFGRNGALGPGLPTGGAATGLLRSLALEWPHLAARVVDFRDSGDVGQIAEQVLAELLHDDAATEVGYDGHVRRVFGAAPASLEPVGARPRRIETDAQWVVLATGGARGITAETLRALARPGMTVVLAGRREPTRTQDAALDGLPAAKLRERFIDEMREKVERPKPAAIEARVQAVLRDREILHTVARLEEAGVTVIYRSCDVRDPDACRELVEWTYATCGRIDAVIHGAGVIEDKLLVEKDPISFDRVFDTKVDSTFVLSQCLHNDLSLFVFFSSVAGRFGNRGQADYAAANEVLNRFAWYLQWQWPSTRVVSINWGPWSGIGMASDAVRAVMAERGVAQIAPEAGRAFLRDEIALGGPDDVEVVAGHGPWNFAPARSDEPSRPHDSGFSMTTS